MSRVGQGFMVKVSLCAFCVEGVRGWGFEASRDNP